MSAVSIETFNAKKAAILAKYEIKKNRTIKLMGKKLGNALRRGKFGKVTIVMHFFERWFCIDVDDVKTDEYFAHFKQEFPEFTLNSVEIRPNHHNDYDLAHTGLIVEINS